MLNRSKQKTILLVHGLFASSGYWLQYLPVLKNFRLIILEIDFTHIRNFKQYVQSSIEIINSASGGTVDAVISHSLGTLLAIQLPEGSYHTSFEICPVYCAKRNNVDNFVEEIKYKLNNSKQDKEIIQLLNEVDFAISQHPQNFKSLLNRSIYIPDEDQYFSYLPASTSKEFKGDHFEISYALEDIVKELT